MSKPVLTLVLTWAALLVLLAITVGATFAPIGPVKPVVNMAVAFAKAGLIFWVFMHLREQGGLNRVVAVAAVVWVLTLVILTHADVGARGLFSP